MEELVSNLTSSKKLIGIGCQAVHTSDEPFQNCSDLTFGHCSDLHTSVEVVDGIWLHIDDVGW